MEMSGQLHSSAALLPRKEYPVPIAEEGWWAPSRSGRVDEEKKYHRCPPAEV